ncbi:hypothetical protein FNF28_04681 [Cafeteria roenbergensis]|uniref:BTB domain-containing protein n=1 Tax=Cafeteria roenbergensis TaxID=33653 RepID=A0A5A8DD90_CAFRO|nr:hypothetical protein FNF28_04681 [Cafeteria roenbergensis]
MRVEAGLLPAGGGVADALRFLLPSVEATLPAAMSDAGSTSDAGSFSVRSESGPGPAGSDVGSGLALGDGEDVDAAWLSVGGADVVLGAGVGAAVPPSTARERAALAGGVPSTVPGAGGDGPAAQDSSQAPLGGSSGSRSNAGPASAGHAAESVLGTDHPFVWGEPASVAELEAQERAEARLQRALRSPDADDPGPPHRAAPGAVSCLWSWGRGEYGVLGTGGEGDAAAPSPVLVPPDLGAPRIVAVACGWYHCAAVTDLGTLYTWGSGADGALGDGSGASRFRPAIVPFFGVENPVFASAVACGSDVMGSHTLVVATGCLASESEADAGATAAGAGGAAARSPPAIRGALEADGDADAAASRAELREAGARGRLFAFGRGTALGRGDGENLAEPGLVQDSAKAAVPAGPVEGPARDASEAGTPSSPGRKAKTAATREAQGGSPGSRGSFARGASTGEDDTRRSDGEAEGEASPLLPDDAVLDTLEEEELAGRAKERSLGAVVGPADGGDLGQDADLSSLPEPPSQRPAAGTILHVALTSVSPAVAGILIECCYVDLPRSPLSPLEPRLRELRAAAAEFGLTRLEALCRLVLKSAVAAGASAIGAHGEAGATGSDGGDDQDEEEDEGRGEEAGRLARLVATDTLGPDLALGLLDTRWHDVVLVAQGGERFPAHRAIVCARSPFLRMLLLGGSWASGAGGSGVGGAGIGATEDQDSGALPGEVVEVALPDTAHAVWRLLVHCYTGYLQPPSSAADPSLDLVTADRYGCERMRATAAAMVPEGDAEDEPDAAGAAAKPTADAAAGDALGAQSGTDSETDADTTDDDDDGRDGTGGDSDSLGQEPFPWLSALALLVFVIGFFFVSRLNVSVGWAVPLINAVAIAGVGFFGLRGLLLPSESDKAQMKAAKAKRQGITTVECDDLPAGRPVGLLGLHSLGKSSFPGSSVPFEPLSVFPGHAQEVWAGLGMGSKKGDLPPEELIATPFDHPAQSVASNTKEMFHRYPQFTQADVDAAKLKNLRRIHDLGRWMRFHEDGTTFNDHLAEDEAAVRAHGLRRTPEERLLELAKRQAAPRMKQWGAWAIAFADAPGFDELVEEAASEPGEFAQIKHDIVTAGTYFQQERSDVSEEQMATAEECRLRVDAFMERLVDLGIVARYEPAVGPNVAAMEKRAAKASPIPPTPLKQFVEEDAELREQLRQAVKDGDDVKAKQIAAKMLPLGRRMTQEQTAQALVDEGKGMVTYQRRLARFVDAVYGAETGVSALPQDIADKFWNPHHPRDEHGMPLDDEEELYSLENILGESDPLRKRFLDREATGGLSHRDVRRGGLHLGYCIFCSHGDGHGAPQGLPLLREDNTLLLSKLVAPDGRILPRRFTGVCAKHQRSVSRTIKRSRAMGFMPFQKKLPPQLRFTSMNPDPDLEPRAYVPPEPKEEEDEEDERDKEHSRASADLDAALEELQSMLDVDDAGDSARA